MTATRSLAVVDAPYYFDRVVVGLHLRWDGVFQRPQHLLSRIARNVPVLIVEEPVADGSSANEVFEAAPGVTVLRPHCAAPPADAIDEATIALVRGYVGDDRPLIWLYTPMMAALCAAFPAAPLVFDAMDELARFAHADPRLAARESTVLARAQMVFCGGPSLYRSRKNRAKHVKLYSSGVDVDFFEQARSCDPHAKFADLRRPIFGYIGVIDERVDLPLIAAIADALPQSTVAMIGPTAKIESTDLPQRDNIVYLGQQPYSELPAFLAGIDVAMMPFALNESTLNISPTKTLEYLAAGKAIVSTAVPDVVAEYATLVTIARTPAEFIDGLVEAPLVAPGRQHAADERTHAATWDAIGAALVRDLQAVGICARASTQTPDGLRELLCPCAHPVNIHRADGCAHDSAAPCGCDLDTPAAAAAGFAQARDSDA